MLPVTKLFFFLKIIVFQLQRLFLLAKLRGALSFFINSHKGFRTLLKEKDNIAHYSVLKILHKDFITVGSNMIK